LNVLHVLQRITATPVLEAEEGETEDTEGDEEEEAKQKERPARTMLNFFPRVRGKKKSKVPEQFKLVQGDPTDARFEFIAVRQTWISDHLPPALLQALTSAETGEPVPDD
jgi:hypothetical protein